MLRTKRIPEGGAIEDGKGMSAEAYGELMRSRLEGEYRGFAEEALRFAPPPQGGKVLEIGPGPGWAGLMLIKARPDLRLEGVDASADMVRAAAANANRLGLGDRASYRVGAAESLDGLPAASIDLVISRDSLHHWEDPRRAFASILNVLKPSGSLYLSDERRDLSLPAWLIVYALGTATMGGMARYWRSSIRAAYTPPELEALLPPAPGREWTVEGGFMDLQVKLGPAASAR